MANDSSELLRLDPFNNGNLLQGMFMYQRSLVDKYIELGKLPGTTGDFNNKNYQLFLKKTISNFSEELAEAAENSDKALQEMQGIYTEPEVQNQIINHAKNLGVELADALHFLIELMIYSNVNDDDVALYYKELAREQNLLALSNDDGLATAFAFARHLNIYHDGVREHSFTAYKMPGVNPDSLDTPLMKISPDLFKEFDRLFWKINKTLLLGQNVLKLREWRSQDQVVTAVNTYQHRIMETFTYFMQLCDAMSITSNMMYAMFEQKNFINQQRIIDGY